MCKIRVRLTRMNNEIVKLLYRTWTRTLATIIFPKKIHIAPTNKLMAIIKTIILFSIIPLIV